DVRRGDVLAAAQDHLAGHARYFFFDFLFWLIGLFLSPSLLCPGLGGSNILSSIGSSKITWVTRSLVVIGPICVLVWLGIFTPEMSRHCRIVARKGISPCG